MSITPALSFVFAYSRIHLNCGQLVDKGEEKSDQYSLGVGVNYWVKASAGINFKHIYSRRPYYGQGQGIIAKVNSYDYGLLINVPFVGVVSQLRDEPLQILPFIFPFFDLSIGLSKNNLGNKKVIYADAAQADPLPRYARVGIGFDFGMFYKKGEVDWQLLSFKWTIEANDVLVPRYSRVVDSLGHVMRESFWEYQPGLGDINFFDELVLGNTNPETIKKKGWELNFFEFIFIRYGRFEEDFRRGNRCFKTSGYSVRLAGFVKLLRSMGVHLATNTVFGFIINHIDASSNYSELITDEINHPLSGTKFSSFNIFITN